MFRNSVEHVELRLVVVAVMSSCSVSCFPTCLQVPQIRSLNPLCNLENGCTVIDHNEAESMTPSTRAATGQNPDRFGHG